MKLIRMSSLFIRILIGNIKWRTSKESQEEEEKCSKENNSTLSSLRGVAELELQFETHSDKLDSSNEDDLRGFADDLCNLIENIVDNKLRLSRNADAQSRRIATMDTDTDSVSQIERNIEPYRSHQGNSLARSSFVDEECYYTVTFDKPGPKVRTDISLTGFKDKKKLVLKKTKK